MVGAPLPWQGFVAFQPMMQSLLVSSTSSPCGALIEFARSEGCGGGGTPVFRTGLESIARATPYLADKNTFTGNFFTFRSVAFVSVAG